MVSRDPEYDRFGPWVIEISDEDPPPPLFRQHLTREEPALISVKIPRPISRRDARPGMDLYDYLVSLYEDDIVVLERDGDAVRSRTFPYRDVRFVCLTDALLRGGIHLGVPGGAYDLPYSAVSQPLMRRLVDCIRERYVSGTVGPSTGAEVDPGSIAMSFYFEGMLKAERSTPSDMRLVAAQAETPLASRHDGSLRRFLYGVVDKRLLETMHLCDGRELKIIDRGRTFAYRWQSVYGTSTAYLPLANLVGVDWSTASSEDTVKLVLRTAGGACSYAFMQDNPTIDGYRDLLASWSAVQGAGPR